MPSPQCTAESHSLAELSKRKRGLAKKIEDGADEVSSVIHEPQSMLGLVHVEPMVHSESSVDPNLIRAALEYQRKARMHVSYFPSAAMLS